MQESIHKYFQVGTIHFMSYPETMKGEGDIIGTLRKVLSDDFYSAVEVTWMKDPKVRAEAAKLIRESGIKVCYGAQPRLLTTGLNPNAIDENDRKLAEDTLIEAIDEAEELGASGIAFLSGKYDDDKKDIAYSQLLKTTKNLCDYAAKKNMMVELEVFDFDIDKKSLIGPAPYSATFAADMRNYCSNFGLVVDLSHFPLTYEDSRFVITTLKPYITHLHFGNAVADDPNHAAYGDMHPRFGFPNSANTIEDLKDFLAILKEEGFFRADDPMVLSFEVKPWADEDPDMIVANTKRALNRAWAML